MNRILFFLLLSSFGYTQKYQPKFSTGGFYQTDKSVREAINFNVGWRFLKQDVTGAEKHDFDDSCLLYTSPSPRDEQSSRIPSSA